MQCEIQRGYADWLRGLGPGVHQIMTHIARVSDDYASKIHGAHFRAGDLAWWASGEMRANRRTRDHVRRLPRDSAGSDQALEGRTKDLSRGPLA